MSLDLILRFTLVGILTAMNGGVLIVILLKWTTLAS